jgi:hypothetical protein
LQALVPDEEDTGVIGSVSRCVRPNDEAVSSSRNLSRGRRTAIGCSVNGGGTEMSNKAKTATERARALPQEDRFAP